MGESSVTGGPGRPFSAEQLFDDRSDYGRLRAGMKPEAKLRGFFHYLAVLQKNRTNELPSDAFAARTSTARNTPNLVINAGSPDSTLESDVMVRLMPSFGGRGRLVLDFRVKDRDNAPPPGTTCRAFLLTPGMIERLCGPDAARSPEMARKAFTKLLSGEGDTDPLEAARILAAVPELEGEMETGGFGRFPHFELPEQASCVDELPERTTVIVVINTPRE